MALASEHLSQRLVGEIKRQVAHVNGGRAGALLLLLLLARSALLLLSVARVVVVVAVVSTLVVGSLVVVVLALALASFLAVVANHGHLDGDLAILNGVLVQSQGCSLLFLAGELNKAKSLAALVAATSNASRDGLVSGEHLLQILVGELERKIADVEDRLGRLLLAGGGRGVVSLVALSTLAALTARTRFTRFGGLKLIAQLALGVAAVILVRNLDGKGSAIQLFSVESVLGLLLLLGSAESDKS